jgi:hypothetical protein
MMDSKNPLKVLVIGSLFNLVGDVALCTFLGYGIAGAAWATIVAQVGHRFRNDTDPAACCSSNENIVESYTGTFCFISEFL